MENQNNALQLLDGGIREQDGYLGEPGPKVNDSTYYDSELDSQCLVPARSLKSIKAELGLDVEDTADKILVKVKV